MWKTNIFLFFPSYLFQTWRLTKILSHISTCVEWPTYDDTFVDFLSTRRRYFHLHLLRCFLVRRFQKTSYSWRVTYSCVWRHTYSCVWRQTHSGATHEWVESGCSSFRLMQAFLATAGKVGGDVSTMFDFQSRRRWSTPDRFDERQPSRSKSFANILILFKLNWELNQKHWKWYLIYLKVSNKKNPKKVSSKRNFLIWQDNLVAEKCINTILIYITANWPNSKVIT